MLAPLTVTVFASLARFVLAQTPDTTVLATCLPGYQWAFNSAGDSPCKIAGDLVKVCTGRDYIYWPLPVTWNYYGPSSTQQNPCLCSSVVYSLMSACSDCQDRAFVTWSNYTSNCPNVYRSSFPLPLPPDTPVPHYAYLDVVENNRFSPSAAALAAGPESTLLIPTSTSSIRTLTSPRTTGTTIPTARITDLYPTLTPEKKSNAGAIAGGVIGGLAFIGVLVALLLWHRQRRRASNAPAPLTSPLLSETTGTSSAPPMKVYDPSDPTTFPKVEPSYYSPSTMHSTIPTSEPAYYSNTPNTLSDTPYRHSNIPPNYRGAPEL